MRRKIMWTIVAIVVVIVGIFGYGYYKAHATLNDMYNDVDKDQIREDEVALKGEPFSILLLGIDKDESRPGVGRSDTIIVATVNPKLESTILQSIERDTLVEIVGQGMYDKINHSYAYGGASMTINTVQQFLEIPIDYYVEIDMEGLAALVDAVGGVTIENDRLEFSYGGHYFPIGTLELGGDAALAYARMRYEDPAGDFGRQMRQRQVIQALVKKGASFPVTRYNAIMDAVGSHMKTSLTMSDLTRMSTRYMAALKNMEEYTLEGYGGIHEDGVWYLEVPEENRLEAVNRLRAHLQLS